MNRPAINEDRAEALRLKDELYKQAQFYRKHAPACATDIALFEDAAAQLDSYQAGLALVTPHPLMRAELVQWIDVEESLPDDDRTVLIFTATDPLGEPWPGYRKAGQWFAADGMPLGQKVTHWADMPVGPAQVKTQSNAAEELAA